MTEQPGSSAWLALHNESALDPDRPIIDPHHHLWRRNGSNYLLDDLWQDTQTGHRIEKTVFIECHAEYRKEGAEHLKPLGETEFVAAQAEKSEQNNQRATIAGIVGHVDLRLAAKIEPILKAHIELGGGRFRGIRHAGAHATHPEGMTIIGRAPEGLYEDEGYRTGLRLLGEMGMSFDTWHYHYQNTSFINLAEACPGTTMILDHFGTPLGVGAFANKRQTIFTTWQRDIEAIAKCSNVIAKLGGLAMPDNGFGWSERASPPSSDEFADLQSPYYTHTIDCFGSERCMMESNFPVDKLSISYGVLYNGLKKIAGTYGDAEQHQLFYGTADKIYKLS